MSAAAPSLPETNFMPVGNLAVSLTFFAAASPGLVHREAVAGRRADELHCRAFDFDMQRPAVNNHAFGQIDVGTAIAAGLHADSDLARLPSGQLDFDRSLIAGGERSELVRHRLIIAGVQGHQGQRDVFGRAAAVITQLELVKFFFAEHHLPRPVQAHGQLGLLHFNQGLRRHCLKSQCTANSNGLLWRGMIFSVSFSLEWASTRRSSQRQGAAGSDCGNDLARTRRGGGHFGPVGQAERDGDFFGRLAAGVLQHDLIRGLLAHHDLSRPDCFHAELRTLVIDEHIRILDGRSNRPGGGRRLLKSSHRLWIRMGRCRHGSNERRGRRRGQRVKAARVSV